MKTLITLLLGIVLLAGSCNRPQSNSETTRDSELLEQDKLDTDQLAILTSLVDLRVNETLENPLINSLSIGVYLDGKSAIFHYGELVKGTSIPPSDSTIYEIASVTKTFTGTLAAKAVMEGKIELEADIRNYLKQDLPNLQFQGEGIKIHHLLTHTSGLPNVIGGLNNIPRDLDELAYGEQYLKISDQHTRDTFFDFLSTVQLSQQPGSIFNYSNFGSNLIGYILETVYETPYQELILNEVVAKADLQSTYFSVPENKAHLVANGYRLGEPMPATNIGNVLWGAEGALRSTPSDLIRYIEYQLSDDLVVKESHRKFYEIDTDYWIGYFWWSIENMDHDFHYRHDGGISRAKNALLIYPDKRIGLSIITNESSLAVSGLLSKLSKELYLDLKQLDQ